MITPNELRIGNIIGIDFTYEDGWYSDCEVTGITDDYLYHTLETGRGGTQSKWENVRAVELTPEWLERCGFEISESSRVYFLNVMYFDSDYPCTLNQPNVCSPERARLEIRA